MPRALEITVRGVPAPQGSKRHVGHGVMVESSAKVKPWREDVKWAALTAVKEAGGGLKGAIELRVVFSFRRPKSVSKKSQPLKSTKPDLDKLVRSTGDALTSAGAYEDDSRIVRLIARKVFVNEDVDALDVEGAKIWLSEA